ncbi:hypothethical protein (plasmid) [Ralstonia solanacearum CMR15]|nr:hypothethical protein [Ralstonia solanacearum CMR15]
MELVIVLTDLDSDAFGDAAVRPLQRGVGIGLARPGVVRQRSPARGSCSKRHALKTLDGFLAERLLFRKHVGWRSRTNIGFLVCCWIERTAQ